MTKRLYILSALSILVLLFFSFFWIFPDNSQSYSHPIKKSISPKKIPSSSFSPTGDGGFNPTVSIFIQKKFNQSQMGTIISSYSFGEHYLIGANTNLFQPSSTYPYDEIVWSKDIKGKVINQILASGTYLRLFLYHGSPFIPLQTGKMVIFNKGVSLKGSILPTDGYAYLVNQTGAHLFFHFKGSFVQAKLTSTMNLLVFTKKFYDPTGSLPFSLKPYYLNTYELQNKHFKLIYQHFMKPTIK